MSRASALLAGLIVMAACAVAPPLAFAQTPITFQYFYDPTGQLIRVVDSTGVVIEYVYDAVGNMLEVRRSNVNPTQLTILGFSPMQGGRGAVVTIEGIGFSSQPAANIVSFNGTPAPVTSITANTLVARVPAGASSGPIAVSVGSDAATSASSFTVLALPVVTSVTPRVIDSTRPPETLTIAGANLTGIHVEALPSFVPQAIAFGTPQVDATGAMAIVPVSLAPSARGTFVLVATSDAGSSDAFPSNGNTISVFNAQDDVDSDGDGFPDGLELLFGSDPFNAASVPNFAAAGEATSATFSIVNAVLAQALNEHISSSFSVSNSSLPPGDIEHLLSAGFSVLNSSLAFSGVQELVSPAVSVSNGSLAPTSQIATAAAESVLNSSSSLTTISQQVQTSPKPSPATNTPVEAREPSITLDQLRDGDRLIEGQTIVLKAIVEGLASTADVAFGVNGRTMATDSRAPFQWMFTVPVGPSELTFTATTRASGANQPLETSVSVVVQPDPGTTITGRVVDSAGNPIQGAVVDLLSEGLKAEYFKFGQPLLAVPDLSGLTPDNVTRVTALNIRNPSGLFGTDPFGSRLGPDYAARFSGWVAIPTAGVYRFALGAHEGARLRIAGTTVVDISTGSGEYQEAAGDVALPAGIVPIEVTHYEGVGSAELQLSFTPPGGERQVVPPSALVPAWQPLVATTDATGTFTLRGVPTALEGARVRAAVTREGRNVSAISDRVRAVPGAVTAADVVIVVPQR